MERNSATDLAALAGVVLALIVGLHQAGGVPGLSVDWDDPIGWVRHTPPDLVVGAFLRQLGLILGYWVVGSTAVYAVARVGDRPIRWAHFVTFPLARRLVDRAVTTSLALSLLGSAVGTAAATEVAVVFEPSGDGIPVPHVRVIDPPPAAANTTTAASDTGIRPIPGRPANAAEPASPPVGVMAPEATYIVVEGDNLWTIAVASLGAAAGPAVDADRIVGHWRRIIELNRKTLRSGDPNLIYPGEVISLPAVEASS